MAKVIEKSAKTVEDALKAALEELGVEEVDVEYEIIEEASRGFLGIIGTKPAKIRVTVKENKDNVLTTEVERTKDTINDKKEIINEKEDRSSEGVDETKIKTAIEFLQDIFDNMKLDVKIETKHLEEGYIFNLHGENIGILIGKHGQTLDALQYLVNLAANRNDNQRLRFIIDVENYRSRRAETLQNLARNLADRAVRMNQDVRLEPMNRHERKVIHSSLQDYGKVVTHSAGEEPYRYIIISPKKYGKSRNIDKTDSK